MITNSEVSMRVCARFRRPWLVTTLLLFLLFVGCGEKPPAINSTTSAHPAERTVKPPTTKSGATAVQIASTHNASLSSDEKKEFATLSKWVKEATWSWESDQNYKRQRPVGLIVLRPDGLEFTIPTTLRYARGLANASWDVKILLHWTGNERSDLTSIKDVRDRIADINKELEIRNTEEAGKLPADVAPLRLIDVPVTFKNKEELENSIEQWLASNFRDEQKPNSKDIHPISRPPFGGISFSGHGRSAQVDHKKGKQINADVVLQFQVTEEDWFDLSWLEARALRKYQAPVWVLTDLCRNEKGSSEVADVDIDVSVMKLKRREFDNISKLSDMDRRYIDECESLRANASAGFLHRAGSVVTTLNATNRRFRIKHEENRLLHGHLGAMLEREAPPDEFARAHFKNLPNPTTSITLLKAESWAAERLRANSGSQRPGLSRGTLSERVVIFSTLRGKDVYTPQYPNLLSGGVSLATGGFTVPELSDITEPGGGEHYGAVTIIRNQKEFDNNFKAIFRFNQPFSLAESRDLQLVLNQASPQAL